jgi:NAD(P) transhydrogenase subunit alpha
VAQLSLALVAVVLATVNIVGGFVVTDRMLEMFRRPDARGAGAGSGPAGGAEAAGAAATQPVGARR